MPTAETLSSPVASHLLQGLMALRQGDFSRRLPSDLTGIEGKLADTFNEVVAMNQRMALEQRISHAVERRGRLSQRASVGDVRGSWAASVDSVNTLIDDLVHPTTEMARVIGEGRFMDTISILVVDDTRQNLVTLEAILEEPGLKVVGVSSAREALRRLLTQEFAAILLDVHMPDMDGFETASLIRQRPLSKHTPILFLTAYAVEAQLTRAYALGAVDCMPTPVQPDVLKAKEATEARLLDADRRKDESLAMLAHELRNPLAAISSAVTVARTPQLERERNWNIAVIGRHVRHLEKLIDDLMDVSRITLGKIEMRRERLDLSIVLARAADAVRAQVAERRQQIDIALPAIPLWADADPTRIEQVFVNLLGNASKYSHDGGCIWFSAIARSGVVEVHVRDEGIGLEPGMAERVFDLFAQAQTGLDRAKGGLGIGLSLAQRLTDRHGGSIRVHSDGPGRGAEFVVTLPLVEPVVQAARPPAVPASAPEVANSQTVLLVDDDVDTTRALSLLLTHAGFEVVTAQDGGEALERAGERPPDIVLLDLGLPVVDGYRVAEVLRARPGGGDMLLVAIPGYGLPEDRERSKAVGFDHHLVKPIDCVELIALMRSGVGTRADGTGLDAATAG